jgi:predicted nucleic acid-binding protein
MSASDFLDSNVLVYAYQFNDPRKQRVAQELVRGAVAGKALISTQVLAEFTAILLHKFASPVPPDVMIGILDKLSSIKVITPDAGLVRRAVEAQSLYKLHFYDCMIVAAAERAGCERIWSEDLNASQMYFGVTVANPFAKS